MADLQARAGLSPVPHLLNTSAWIRCEVAVVWVLNDVRVSLINFCICSVTVIQE